MFIFQIDTAKILGNEDKKGNNYNQKTDHPDSVFLQSLQGAPEGNHISLPPQSPRFPMFVNIDLDHDGNNDYFLKDGKIYHYTPEGMQEVSSIPGVDLKKLFETIKQKFEECKNDPAHQGEKPFPCVMVQFCDDINGDGKIDHIMADLGVRTMQSPTGTDPAGNNIRPPEHEFGKIIDLSNALLMDPYNHLIQIPELGKALAKHTKTEYTLGKADKLFDFFLRDKSDLTGDGQIDYKDVIAFWWKISSNNPPPRPPIVPLTPQQQINNRPMELD